MTHLLKKKIHSNRTKLVPRKKGSISKNGTNSQGNLVFGKCQLQCQLSLGPRLFHSWTNKLLFTQMPLVLSFLFWLGPALEYKNQNCAARIDTSEKDLKKIIAFIFFFFELNCSFPQDPPNHWIWRRRSLRVNDIGSALMAPLWCTNCQPGLGQVFLAAFWNLPNLADLFWFVKRTCESTFLMIAVSEGMITLLHFCNSSLAFLSKVPARIVPGIMG